MLIVTAFNGDGVQIIDITDPSNPSPVSVGYKRWKRWIADIYDQDTFIDRM